MARCLGRVDAGEKAHDFIGTEDHGEVPRLLWRGDEVVERPGFLERDLIEKPQRADRNLERTRSELSLAGQIHLVGANFLGAQRRRGLAEVAGEAGDVLHGPALGMRRQISHLHVLEHALPCQRL